jgi:TolB-like protein/Tfp pilus assembly protein PilF
MGEVWRARDSRLNRIVAIKTLKAESVTRFLQEARAIAALNHPHICTLHDIGPDYLVMEFLEGEPLKGPLPPDQTIRLGMQIASALAAAHKQGILHRDLKPANVLVTESGAKLLDFGLAKAMVDNGAAETAQTMAGTLLGTAAYMSPEQAQGKVLDERSDVFSFGAVLYELLSGKRAFPGDSMIDVLSSVVRDEPSSLAVSPEIADIIKRCMRKNPGERFQMMSEVRAALEQCGSKPGEKQPSIAVLPFTNLSADKENEYFSDGLSEEILNALSQVSGLQVAARSSSFFFKGKGTELSEIAAKLRVSTVLEGSVRRAGNRVRVTVQLVDAANGFHLWSERYDRQMEDIFEVQDEIARAIAERLTATLGAGVKQTTRNPQAYDLYLKGRHLWHQRSPASVRAAIHSFEEAIKLDPQYALAYAGLSDCYGILRVYGWVRADEGRDRARAAMAQAMALDPSLWEVHFARAFYTFYFEHDWRQAGQHFLKAIEINPRSSLAQGYYAVFLAGLGRVDEAVSHAGIALKLDPLAAFIHGLAATAFCTCRRFEDAERAARQALELQPGYLFGLWFHGLSLSGLRRGPEAVEEFERVVGISRAPIYVGFLGMAYCVAGRTTDALRLLDELEDRAARGEFVPAFTRLSIYTGQNDVPAIRQSLKEALGESTAPLTLQCITCQFPEETSSDPEIQRLLAAL